MCDLYENQLISDIYKIGNPLPSQSFVILCGKTNERNTPRET